MSRAHVGASHNRAKISLAGAKAATALTTAITGWQFDLEVWGVTKVNLMFTYVWSSATSVEIQISRSADGTTYYPDQRITPADAFEDDEITRAVTASDSWGIPIDVSDTPYLRVEAKRTGGSASDTLALDYSAGAV